MKQHGIIVAIVIFGLIIAGMFVFAFLKRSELTQEPSSVTPVVTETKTPYDGITRIDAKHFFIDGVHTIAGEVMLPSTCDLINWDTIVRESMPEGVTLAFTVINNAESCTEATVPQRFLVTFTASENATIDATLNGRTIELNLIPALPGEKPEDFELYLKG
jgi:hypothetical protein